MKEGAFLRGLARMLTPGVVSTVYYLIRCRAKVSPRAEVDVTARIAFGRGCVVSSFCKIKASEGPLTIGERGGVAAGCFISAGAAGITIGRNFICGPNVAIVGQNYSHNATGVHLEDLGVESHGITMGDNVWLGAGTTVVDGSRIGDDTIVVANSLVNGSYPDGVVLQGMPARVVLRR